MAFEVLQTEGKQARETKVTVSYKRFRTKNGQAKRPRLTISMPNELARSVGVKKQSEPWAILLGRDADLGKARLLPHPNGTGHSVMMGRAAALRFGFVPMLGADAADREYVDYRIVDHPHGKGTVRALEIALPAWFKAD